MGRVTVSFLWSLHPGDIVIAETHGEYLRILHRTPNDLEAQNLLAGYEKEGREVVVFQFRGTTGK